MEAYLKPPTDVQLKRREKELSLLSKLPPSIKYSTSSAPIGFSIQVEIVGEHFKSPEAKAMTFTILLDYKYPFQAPRVYYHSKTDFTWLADGRNLANGVLGREWQPSITLYDIILALPAFCENLFANKDTPEIVKATENFYLGEIYDTADFDKTSFKIFKCEEEMMADSNSTEPRIGLLSSNVLLLFDPEKPSTVPESYCTLVFWSNLCFLEKMQRNLKIPNVLQMYWTQNENEPMEVKLTLPNAESFIQDMVQKMQNLGARVNCNKKNAIMAVNETIPSEEQLIAIKNAIRVLEQKDPKDPKVSMELMKKYQKAVEYYSAIDSKEYTVYLEKIRDLIRLQDPKP